MPNSDLLLTVSVLKPLQTWSVSMGTARDVKVLLVFRWISFSASR